MPPKKLKPQTKTSDAISAKAAQVFNSIAGSKQARSTQGVVEAIGTVRAISIAVKAAKKVARPNTNKKKSVIGSATTKRNKSTEITLKVPKTDSKTSTNADTPKRVKSRKPSKPKPKSQRECDDCGLSKVVWLYCGKTGREHITQVDNNILIDEKL
eukprot:Tbor_TRINITY_DN2576_c0_g1::TRINITY_DN2576_c0_g1_i1::g.480::m.480